ncbi:hypothetical protein FRB97_004762 [Tulasnella sp. 331]|nr:hypothetical protein FRB97_004762 [Tulasnella sp. 331]
MYGFNVTAQTFPYDNRPMTPLMNLPFEKWWFHGFLDYPPNDGDVFEFAAGGSAMMEVACNKGLTSYWASSEGSTDIRQADGYPCPGPGQGYAAGLSQSSLHTTSYADVAGTGIAIVDKMDPKTIVPSDFAVFTTNRTSPWVTETYYQVPVAMPACTGDYCHCAWFWIHNDDSGSEQNYMTAFRCKITNVSSQAKKIAAAQVPRFCPNDPSNCTTTAMQPFYWYQAEQNNMPEGTYDPPMYQQKYGFNDGPQEYIFETSSGNTAVSGATPTPTAATAAITGTTTTNGGVTLDPVGATSSQTAAAQSTTPAQPAAAAGSITGSSTTKLTKQCKRRVKTDTPRKRGLLNRIPVF